MCSDACLCKKHYKYAEACHSTSFFFLTSLNHNTLNSTLYSLLQNPSKLHTHTHNNTQAHTQTHARTHTHTHIHIHTQLKLTPILTLTLRTHNSSLQSAFKLHHIQLFPHLSSSNRVSFQAFGILLNTPSSHSTSPTSDTDNSFQA